VFRGSAVKRIGRDRFVRNVLIAIGNSGEPALARAAEALLSDTSPLVRAMAVWALSKLLARKDFTRLSEQYAAKEDDPAVAAEWREVAA
jgi:epoxyqueuosine reductase